MLHQHRGNVQRYRPMTFPFDGIWHMSKRFDTYAGVMYTAVHDGHGQRLYVPHHRHYLDRGCALQVLKLGGIDRMAVSRPCGQESREGESRTHSRHAHRAARSIGPYRNPEGNCDEHTQKKNAVAGAGGTCFSSSNLPWPSGRLSTIKPNPTCLESRSFTGSRCCGSSSAPCSRPSSISPWKNKKNFRGRPCRN